MEEDNDIKGAESGCVTSVGSPVLFNEERQSTPSNQTSPDHSSSVDGTTPSSKIDLNAVSSILTSSFRLAFKSFSDDDCNTKADLHSFPYIFKHRHYKKERRRNRQPLKSECPICHDKDRHHSYLCQVRESFSSKSQAQDSKGDKRAPQRKEMKKRRIKNKERYRKNRADGAMKSSSSESVESSDSLPINAFSSPPTSRHSSACRPIEKHEKHGKQQAEHEPQLTSDDTADSLFTMYPSDKSEGQAICDDGVSPASHMANNGSANLANITDIFNVNVEPYGISSSKDNDRSRHYIVHSDEDDKLVKIATQRGPSSLSHEIKSAFETQKVTKPTKKFYKSLERKLPNKDMTYVDIEISDDNSLKSNGSRGNVNKQSYTRDSETYINDIGGVPPFYVSTNQTSNSPDEQVVANVSQRYADSANSQIAVASDNAWCAVSSYGYAYGEPTSSLGEYDPLACDYNYCAQPDANHYLCDSTLMLPPVMPNTEGQTKVKKNTPKTRTNGVVGSDLQKSCPDNDNKGEGQCPNSDLRVTKLAENCDNHISESNIGSVASVGAEVLYTIESLGKGTLPSSDCNNSESNRKDGENSAVKFPSPEIDSSQVSVRPKTYFNMSRKSCKYQYNLCSSSPNGNEIDSSQYLQFDSSCHQRNQDAENDMNCIGPITNEEPDQHISLGEENSSITCMNTTFSSILPMMEGSADGGNENIFNPSLSKYYDESSVEQSANDCCDLDEIDTLPENYDNKTSDDTEELDEEEIILTGKFKNLMNYSEKVAKISDEDDSTRFAFPTEVILIDDSDLPITDEAKCVEKHKKEFSDTQLMSELTQLQLKDNNFSHGVGVELQSDMQPPSDDSARSSCERDSSDGDDSKNRIKRSSSLKCGKAPPGTPGRKKIVRFADVLGLDLADVRTFLEGVPDVPKSAFCDLQVEEEAAASLAGQSHGGTVTMAVSRRILTAMFQQPGSLPDFLNRVRFQKVSLENLTIGDDLSVRGIVRVYNIDFHKSVFVRYTFDHWRNSHETQASYVNGSSDGFSDRFSFLLWGSFLQCNGALVFCIRYCTKGQEFWDNNIGSNYVLQCYPAAAAGRGLEGRPQNDTNVQQASADKTTSGGGRAFGDTPTTPPDPWVKRFF